ncbi:MAG TPA: ABC transporter ATP-binding protein [Trueperaceae bacterium]|nr:ABC transporter ATP-binding protein [Trueperaceae bacterium]
MATEGSPLTAARLLWPRSTSALLGAAAALVNAVLRVAIVPVFVTPLFDDVLRTADAGALPGVLWRAGAVALAGSLALWAQDALLGRAAAMSAAAARTRLYDRLLALPPGALPGSSGGLASRVLTDLREVENYVRYGLGSLIAESVTLLAIFVLLFAADAGTAAVLALLVIPVALVLRLFGRSLQRVSTGSLEGTEALGKHLQEGLKHHETVVAFGARRFMLERLERDNRATANAMARRSLLAGAQVPLAQVMLFAAAGALVYFLVGGVQRGELSVGQVVSFLTLVALAATPSQLLPQAYALYKQARSAATRLAALEEAGTEVGAPPPQPVASTPLRPAGGPRGDDGDGGDGEQRGDGEQQGDDGDSEQQGDDGDSEQQGDSGDGGRAAAGRLSARGLEVGFAGHVVVEGLDFEFPPTGLVVVAGPSGSGKTTLLRTMLGFLKPLSGEIRLDGRSVGEVSDEALRRGLAYVPQGYELLSGSVRDALGMGRPAADDEIWRALTATGMDGVVTGLTGGLDAQLGEDGAGLSGGQRQRLAIARALLGSPSALLLDEPTSNLDDAAERGIVELLLTLASERLVVAVAHRPALIAAADRVLELGKNRSVESRA